MTHKSFQICDLKTHTLYNSISFTFALYVYTVICKDLESFLAKKSPSLDKRTI